METPLTLTSTSTAQHGDRSLVSDAMRPVIFSTSFSRAEAVAANYSAVLFLVIFVVVVIVAIVEDSNNSQGRSGIIGQKIGDLGTRGGERILPHTLDVPFLFPLLFRCRHVRRNTLLFIPLHYIADIAVIVDLYLGG